MKIVKKLTYILIILLVIKLLFFKDARQCEKLENETYPINLDKSTNRLKDVKETHLLIDWDCYFDFDTLKKKLSYHGLETVSYFKHPKLKNKVEIMSKFYDVLVDDYRGETDFNIYIIIDTLPVYNYRDTTKGNRMVNVNIFDFKMLLREKGHRVHATDNIQETKDNLKVLSLFDKYYMEKKFDSLQDVFHELNSYPNLKWIVMRNFEDMPHKVTIDEHLDVDLLVSDYYLVKRILDSSSATNDRYENGGNRILNYVIINNKKVLFDFRFVGDNYYDKKLEQEMLNTRIIHPNGFYIPNNNLHLHTLIYHALIHKSEISPTYIEVFKKYGLNDSEINRNSLKTKLDIFMKENRYSYVKPEPSVGYFL